MVAAESDSLRKIAILMVALGIEVSAKVFNHLNEREIELISKEIAKLGKLSREEINEVIAEIHEKLLEDTSVEGGVEYLKGVLEKSVGAHKTMGIIRRLSEVRPFSYFENASGTQIADLICSEAPQIIALVLSYLPAAQSAEVFAQLPEQQRQEVALNLVSLKNVHREAIDNAHKALEKLVVNKGQQFSELVSFEGEGVKNLANILNATAQQIEKKVMEDLKTANPELADQVRKHMFLFEDLVILDDVSLQKVLRQVDMRDLTLSLKMADEKLKNKVFNNLSERVRDITMEEIKFLGPVRLRQAEEAQQKVISVVRKLGEAGEIMIPRRGEQEEFV